MRRTIRLAIAGATVWAFLALAGGASASSNLVCPSGCAFTSIQAAITAVAPGTTITIGPGEYFENLTVTKPVKLKGVGNMTVIYPSVSKPVCSGGSLCGGEASNIILVEAQNVTITKLRLEGDNPKLSSGVEAGGVDIDARNGIITNHALGTPFNNLTVSLVKVSDVYLRGIYASSEGSFDFNHDTVENVQGEEASIAMFNFGGTGQMTANKVSRANDAISANWSRGTHFVKNIVTKSGSGVHTDNNGGFGGEADLIQANNVSECNKDGYGIFVFVPHVSASVEANKIKGCSVGLAAFGGAVSGQGPAFTGNLVNGTGAATSGGGTYGAYLTTDQLGFGTGDLSTTLSGNSISHFTTGMFVTQAGGNQATVTATPNNSFLSNGTGANGEAGTVVNAQNDWWGCAAGPNHGGACNTAIGTVKYEPWLTAKP